MSDTVMLGRLVAVVGAESTGKTTLVRSLCERLTAQGHDVAVVDETLRHFCEVHGRTPHVHEQLELANDHTRRIEAARRRHALVLADTTALMTAVYSDLVFADASLYPTGVAAHRSAHMTLLMALDLPWVADGWLRDGAHVRDPVDRLVRRQLMDHGLPFSVVSGTGEARVRMALSAIEHVLTAPDRAERARLQPRWRWVCENCDDGECEQHWLPGAGGDDPR
jgi:nicotinamide riboside kinase